MTSPNTGTTKQIKPAIPSVRETAAFFSALFDASFSALIDASFSALIASIFCTYFDADSTARTLLFACSGVPTLDGFCGRIIGGGATGRAGLAGGTLGTVGPGVALAFL